MDIKEKQFLELLDNKAVIEEGIKQHMIGIIQRVERALENDPKALLSWKPIPLNLYKQQLQSKIKSSWVFNLRKNTNTGAERYLNSIQRMMSYKGHGDFQTKPGMKWESNLLESDFDGDVEKRWISIPISVCIKD